MKWKVFALAVAIQIVLAVLAAFGGPHGALGGWPWILQMPGILLILSVPSDRLIELRVGAAFVLQTTLWYFVVLRVMRAKQRRSQA